MTLLLNETFYNLPDAWPNDLMSSIRSIIRQLNSSIVVLDDDPTGTQTVHDVPVLTNWTTCSISREFNQETPLFYILTNSRSLDQRTAVELTEEISRNILKASRQTGRNFVVISRSDSTLRGHFPSEVDALAAGLNMSNAVRVIIPFFLEGGRFTLNDTHYVREGDSLVPAAETMFAKDSVFGYCSSNLKDWVEEKTAGRVKSNTVTSLSIDDIRQKGPQFVTDTILNCNPGSVCIINAAEYRDIEVATLGLLNAETKGADIIYRTAASFVRTRAGLGKRPVLSADELQMETGGALILVGSYVARSSKQLEHLLNHTTLDSTELDASRILVPDLYNEEINRVIQRIDAALSENKDIAVYTSREVLTGQNDIESLSISHRISASLVDIVKSLKYKPSYILAKGGITSSDIATDALGIIRARVLGQILPGVPVWETGEESLYPGLPYIVFPGNVGDTDSISVIVDKLNHSRDSIAASRT